MFDTAPYDPEVAHSSEPVPERFVDEVPDVWMSMAQVERDAALDDVNDFYDHWNDVEQGRYDDDPSPYDGTYSEM